METQSIQTGNVPPMVARLGLGLFILVQLAFIVLANLGTLCDFLARQGNGGAAVAWNAIGSVTEPYAFATGQEQYWKMFAPSVPPRAVFVRLDLWTDGKHVPVPSQFERSEGGDPILHLPGAGERLWHVEKNLALPFVGFDAQAVADRPQEWRAFLRGRIARDRHRYLPFMEWKARQLLAAPLPDVIELAVSIHPPSRYDRVLPPERIEPVLRWRPKQDRLDLCAPGLGDQRCRPIEDE